jgi:hypothetical protein
MFDSHGTKEAHSQGFGVCDCTGVVLFLAARAVMARYSWAWDSSRHSSKKGGTDSMGDGGVGSRRRWWGRGEEREDDEEETSIAESWNRQGVR